jgi:hypothetical protein
MVLENFKMLNWIMSLEFWLYGVAMTATWWNELWRPSMEWKDRIPRGKVAGNWWRSSYALRDSGVTRWLVKEAEILDFGFNHGE